MTLFKTGFRPFFLLAALWAAAAMTLWALQLAGVFTVPAQLPGVTWHGHEMVFGYTGAVLAGFLLTATSNWTKRPTASGIGLVGLVGLWLAGRVGAWFDSDVGAIADVTFWFALALTIAVPIIASRSKRNYGFPVLLLVIGGADAALHGGLAVLDALHVGLIAIAAVLVIFGGRIVPLFTRNALRDADVAWSPRWDSLARWLIWALLAAEVATAGLSAALPEARAVAEPIAGGIAIGAGAASLVRARNWRSLATLKTPILWSLHLGFLWIGLGLVARGAVLLGAPLPATVATHALTVGALGTMTFAMMTRVALGHTGRQLKVSPIITVAYGLLSVAVVLRLASTWLPAWALVTAAGCFALAMLLYFLVYLPILVSPRPDGKPG